MAKHKSIDSVPVRHKVFGTPNEISHGIEKLRGRIIQVEELKKDGLPYRDALKVTTEYQIRDTIREIFGEHSPEFHQHHNLKIKVGSKAVVDETIALLHALILSLEERRLELLGLRVRSAEQPTPGPAAPPTASVDSGKAKADHHAHKSRPDDPPPGPSPAPIPSEKTEPIQPESPTGTMPQFTAAQVDDQPRRPTESIIEGSPSMPTERRAGDLTALGEMPSEEVAVPTAGLQEPTGSPASAVPVIRKICSRFHHVARQLRQRREDRATLEVEDENDVQDLLQALLWTQFEDIQPETWTPPYADGAPRSDLWLKQEGVAIVVKKTKQGLGTKALLEQLGADIHRYLDHPDCRALVCFVYDPEGRISNPKGVEAGLMRGQNGRVDVLISPK